MFRRRSMSISLQLNLFTTHKIPSSCIVSDLDLINVLTLSLRSTKTSTTSPLRGWLEVVHRQGPSYRIEISSQSPESNFARGYKQMKVGATPIILGPTMQKQHVMKILFSLSFPKCWIRTQNVKALKWSELLGWLIVMQGLKSTSKWI